MWICYVHLAGFGRLNANTNMTAWALIGPTVAEMPGTNFKCSGLYLAALRQSSSLVFTPDLLHLRP